MPIRALIVDDEAPARDELSYLLEAHPDVDATQAASAAQALERVAMGGIDLVFQDIQMPGQDGFDVLAGAQAQARPPLFIFVTAYDTHAIRAFEENAADYLLKPVSPDRLAKSLERVRRMLAGHADAPGGQLVGAPGDHLAGAPGDHLAGAPGDHLAGAPHLSSAIERLLASAGRGGALPLARLAVEQGGRIGLVPTSEVLLIEAEDKRVVAVTDAGRLTCHGLTTLARAAERLAGLGFFQANRAQLVNLERIAEFVPWFGGKYCVTMADAARTEVTVSRNRVRAFKERLGV